MCADERKVITGAVEGDVDEAVLGRLVNYAGLCLGRGHGRTGKQPVLQSINGYNNAARFHPWIVLLDLNGDCDCAPECLEHWLPRPSQHMCFRVAVRAIEAWVLADRERIARWLGVAQANIPANPDALKNPKQEVVNLARRSHRRIKEDLVPREGSGRSVGPLYNMRMKEFVLDENTGWRPEPALHVSDSLARCINKLQQLA